MLNSTTQLIFKNEARKKLFEGIKSAAEAVICTLGPKGKTVLIQGENGPIVTKDGVTVSKSIRFKDPIKKLGSELIREAATRTNDAAGDGTTTSTTLTYALCAEGLKLLESGRDAQNVSNGYTWAQGWVTEMLKKQAIQICSDEQITQIATISANGDHTIGNLITQAINTVGANGIIQVEDAKGMNTTLTLVEGMQLDRGYLSPYFVTSNEKMHAQYMGAKILITDKKISTLQEILPVLEKVNSQQQPLLIIADDIEGEALQALVLNRTKSALKVVAIRAPGYGQSRHELLQDLCALTGANLVSAQTGISFQDVAKSGLGTAKKITVDAKSTTIISDEKCKELITARVQDIETQLKNIALGPEQQQQLLERAAKLQKGVAIIKVGGSTELEMIEKKYRIEDALHATRAAIFEGIIPGGGVTLLGIAKELRKQVKGYQISHGEDFSEGILALSRAIEMPFRRIVENAGQVPEVVQSRMKKGGYDIQNHDNRLSMIEMGIIDPVKVTRLALEHSVSVANTFMTIDAVICDDAE